MTRHGIAALAAAVLLALGGGAPAAAQSCDQFGSQKEAQQTLEQVGDASGQLDPDGNGFACDGAPAAPPAPAPVLTGPNRNLVEATTINQDGPAASNNAAGPSGVTTEISNAAGAATELAEPGAAPVAETAGAAEEPTARERRNRGDRADRGERRDRGEAGGETAPVGEAAPAAVEEAPPAIAPALEAPAAAAPAAAAPAGGRTAAPVQLPRTGTGTAGEPDPVAAILLLAALAVAWPVGRWVGRP